MPSSPVSSQGSLNGDTTKVAPLLSCFQAIIVRPSFPELSVGRPAMNGPSRMSPSQPTLLVVYARAPINFWQGWLTEDAYRRQLVELGANAASRRASYLATASLSPPNSPC